MATIQATYTRVETPWQQQRVTLLKDSTKGFVFLLLKAQSY